MLIVVNEGDISAIFEGKYETHNELQHYTGSIFNWQWRWGVHFIQYKASSGNLSKIDNIQAKIGIFNAKWPILQDIWEKYNLPFSQIQQ